MATIASIARSARSRAATEIYETLEQQTRIRARFRRVREMLAEQDHILTVDAAGNREDIARQVYTLWQELALG